MARKRRTCYSGIGGQAVLEGVMMKNKEKYAVAVRRPDGGISVEVDNYSGILHGNGLKNIVFVRGIFNFIDSLVLGMRCLNFSASFYEEEPEDAEKKAKSAMGEKLASVLVTCLSVALALGIFIVLPYYLASLMKGYVRNQSLTAIVEGVIRIAIFILYVFGISLMKDIRRLYRYHGAEHKCINCIEKGRPLTVDNAMRSSRLHKRCGTSFIFFVFLVSIVLFFFIRVEQPVARMGLRILLMPIVAGISYEIIRLAGRSNNILVRIISAPGMAVQRMTTKEPDRDMVEVAIAAVETVFDWRQYLSENFGYETEEGAGEESEEELADEMYDVVEEEGYPGAEEEEYLNAGEESHSDVEEEGYLDAEEEGYPGMEEEDYLDAEEGYLDVADEELAGEELPEEERVDS